MISQKEFDHGGREKKKKVQLKAIIQTLLSIPLTNKTYVPFRGLEKITMYAYKCWPSRSALQEPSFIKTKKESRCVKVFI